MVDNEEEAFDFLERLDIEVDDMASRTDFEAKLKGIFSSDGLPSPTRKQTTTLFGIAETKLIDFPRAWIKRVEFTRLGKLQTRFVLPIGRGLFGFSKALQFATR